MKEKIKILIVEPMKKPRVEEIEHTLENLQRLVGGMIQVVYPWEDRAALICDDEGRYKNYPLNRVLKDEDGEPYDVCCGTVLVVGLTEDDFCSLTKEQVERYHGIFKWPEYFMKGKDGCVYCLKPGSGEQALKLT